MLKIRSVLAAKGGAAGAEVFIKSEPAEETHLTSMSANPELPIRGQDAASGRAAFARPLDRGQTGGTKRVRFAPVTKYDEGDVEWICGING